MGADLVTAGGMAGAKTWPAHRMRNSVMTACRLTSCACATMLEEIQTRPLLLPPATTSPSGQNFVCLVRSRLQCHVRRHRHARNKGKFGSYAFLHATPSDYIRSHCTSYFTWSFFFLWIFRDVSKHQSCGMKCYNFLTFDVLNKMNLLLSKLFSFTFMWES